MIIDKNCKIVILNSLIKYHITTSDILEAVEKENFSFENNDLVVGNNRYIDFFEPVKR